jgi:hypothetical protein
MLKSFGGLLLCFSLLSHLKRNDGMLLYALEKGANFYIGLKTRAEIVSL